MSQAADAVIEHQGAAEQTEVQYRAAGRAAGAGARGIQYTYNCSTVQYSAPTTAVQLWQQHSTPTVQQQYNHITAMVSVQLQLLIINISYIRTSTYIVLQLYSIIVR